MSDNPLEHLEELPSIKNYTNNDRYHDFRKVFTTDEGKRVLRYILERGGVFKEPALVSPIDPCMLAAQRGRRQLALEIMAFTYNEPQEPPKQQKR